MQLTKRTLRRKPPPMDLGSDTPSSGIPLLTHSSRTDVPPKTTSVRPHSIGDAEYSDSQAYLQVQSRAHGTLISPQISPQNLANQHDSSNDAPPASPAIFIQQTDQYSSLAREQSYHSMHSYDSSLRRSTYDDSFQTINESHVDNSVFRDTYNETYDDSSESYVNQSRIDNSFANQSHIDRSYVDEGYFNSTYVDESFVSLESKPMGPKELPEYDYDDSTVSTPTISTRQKYRQRLFQHLSRSPSHQDQSYTKPPPLERHRSRSPTDKSPGFQPPYPTNDILLELELDQDTTENGISQDIPNLQYPLSNSISIPPRPTTINNIAPINTHIPRLQNRSSYSTQDSYSPRSLPTKSTLYPIDSRDTEANYATHGSSPTFYYDSNNNEEDFFPNDSLSNQDEELDTFDHNGRSSNADSIPTSYVEYDESSMKTPIVNYFDYSELPELPPSSSNLKFQPDLRRSVLSKSPTKSGSTLTLNTIPSITRKRKDDDLPPVPLDLPQIPFTSASLVSQHLSVCSSVWLLSNVFQWCTMLKIWLHDLFIAKKEFKKALIKLFVFHRRDIPLDIIAKNVNQLMQTFVKAGALEYYELDDSETTGVFIHENVPVTGVLTDLTSCYGGNHEDSDSKLRCYSYFCHLNRKIDHELQLRNTNIHDLVLGDDWAAHWKLTADDLKNIDPNVSKRQSLLYDLLRFEQTFIQRARCFVEEVGPKFVDATKTLINSSSIILSTHLEEDILQPAESLVQSHELLLFEPLLKILISDGKFISSIVEIGELYYNWGLAIQSSLLKYMSTVPVIEALLQNEALKTWMDQRLCNLERVKKLKVNVHILFLSTFNSRYQQLPLQLSDIRKQFDSQEPEYVSLTKAIDAIKKLGLKVNHMKIHADNIYALKRIHKQVVWKHSIRQPNINLGSENRQFIFRGDIERKGELLINSNTNHLILLDNFLLICESMRNAKTGIELFKVIEQPIPVEFLLVEEKEISSSTLNPLSKGKDPNLSPRPSNFNNEVIDPEADPSTFPFKVRYAGRGKHNNFTFFTKSERDRAEWLKHFLEARSKNCARAQKTDPYSLEVVSNTCFAYENGQRMLKLQICAPKDPIYEVSNDALTKLRSLGLTDDIANFSNSRNHIVFSKVQCMEIFDYRGKQFYLVGLASGVYCFDKTNRWKKVLSGTDITKICLDVKINLVVILGNKHLRYYPLDLIINVYYEKRRDITSVSLSNEPVSFFAMGRHREITMLFYAKKKTNSGATNFKLLIPETDNGGIFSAFKVVKKFYVQAECFGISIFNTSFAVHTNKGFEILELDKLLPRSIPDLSLVDNVKPGHGRKNSTAHPGIDLIKKSIQQTNLRPMGMFKLSNNSEFLLVYNDFAIFANKHGKLSRYSILKFQFKAKAVSFTNNNLFIVCDEAIEVWSISDFVNGSNKLIQVIVGKAINMISAENLCFSLANPKVPGLQLLFQMKPKSISLQSPTP